VRAPQIYSGSLLDCATSDGSLVELSSWLDLCAGSLRFTGKSDNGEFDARSMIKGGGAGRIYRPSANAEIAITAMAVNDWATPFFPSRRAQSSQKLRLCQTRQPFRFSCAPHSAQKLGWCIVGGTPILRCVRLYSIVSRRNTIESNGSVVPTVHFATWRSLLLPWHSKFESISNGRMGKRSGRYGPSSDTTALQCLRIGGTPGCKVQRATGILSYPSEHLRLLIGRP